MICKNSNDSFNLEVIKFNKKGKKDWICPICHETFNSRRLLQNHKKESNHYPNNNKYSHFMALSENSICPFCGEEHKSKSGMSLHIRLCKNNPNRDVEESKKLSNIRKQNGNKLETKLKLSKLTETNHFWKYKRNCLTYESKKQGTIKLDSSWELIVAKRLDELNLNWYRPNIRLPYVDNDGVEKGYYPDFYVKDYKCFIEVKHPYFVEEQNKNGKIDYLKSHYDFIFWIEDEELCNTFELHYMNCPHEVEKEIEVINIKRMEKLIKEKEPTRNEKLKEERWKIIQNSNIDFQKFGWVNKISKLFGVATNRGGEYIKKNYPKFYENCYKRNLKLDS